MSSYKQRSIIQVTCSVCNNNVDKTASWSRWGVFFCSKKCHDSRYNEVVRKNQEKEYNQSRVISKLSHYETHD